MCGLAHVHAPMASMMRSSAPQQRSRMKISGILRNKHQKSEATQVSEELIHAPARWRSQNEFGLDFAEAGARAARRLAEAVLALHLADATLRDPVEAGKAKAKQPGG